MFHAANRINEASCQDKRLSLEGLPKQETPPAGSSKHKANKASIDLTDMLEPGPCRLPQHLQTEECDHNEDSVGEPDEDDPSTIAVGPQAQSPAAVGGESSLIEPSQALPESHGGLQRVGSDHTLGTNSLNLVTLQSKQIPQIRGLAQILGKANGSATRGT